MVPSKNKPKIRNRPIINSIQGSTKAMIFSMKMGVTLKSPETVFLSEDTKFGKNVIINPYVVIGKKTKIGKNGKKMKKKN